MLVMIILWQLSDSLELLLFSLDICWIFWKKKKAGDYSIAYGEQYE